MSSCQTAGSPWNQHIYNYWRYCACRSLPVCIHGARSSLLIYFNSHFQVSGTFRMEAPMVLLGYDRSSENVNPGSANATYLRLFITIEPPLTSPEKLKEKVSQKRNC